MRLGGGIVLPYQNPEEWISRVRELGYSAVGAPVSADASKEEIDAYRDCAARNDIVIGEVGVWKNTLSLDDAERKAATDYAKVQLDLAERLRANCCVNITGARGPIWDAYYQDNYSDDTYALIVDSVREIIDAVQPRHTFYTLEPMPWMHPDSPEGYLQLVKDIDRPAFAVHLDFANMINGMNRFIHASDFIRQCFDLLGPHIKSIHAKDVALAPDALPCCLRECAPGKGSLDFRPVLRLAQSLGDETTVFIEHLGTHEEYAEAAAFMRAEAAAAGVPVK